MQPQNLKTKIFLDSGDPKETEDALVMLGFLDGQTTNPSLVAKNPDAQQRLKEGNKFSTDEVFGFYKQVVQKISAQVPQGSVSIEVYSDKNTTASAMLMQANEFYKWIPNAHIKFPTTEEGLKAAEMAISQNMRVNMTLVFSLQQAAAVYAATKGAKKGDVFVSPFIGRLEDVGENGMDLIKNIVEMYKQGDGHVEVLTASVRSVSHFTKAIELGSDIITSPFSILQQWSEAGMPLVSEESSFSNIKLEPMPYQNLDLNKPWESYNVKHDLTDKGLQKFAEDWNNLIG